VFQEYDLTRNGWFEMEDHRFDAGEMYLFGLF
jgi:hypothetical protein